MTNPKTIFKELVLWALFSMVLGFLMAFFGACFLLSLQWAYETRHLYKYLIYFLPISGFAIGYFYHRWGKEVAGGNNLIIDQINNPSEVISWKMLPFILFGTIGTHLFGGSAGREGTAVQMGASLADQFSKWFKLNNETRIIILKSGVAAGFAAVFGTPLAGLIFAFEVSKTGKINYKALFAASLSAFSAYLFMQFYPVPHTHFTIGLIPKMSFINFAWSILAGIVFGLCGLLFNLTLKFLNTQFALISYAPLRPLVGGSIFVVLVLAFGYEFTERFHGLGIEHIVFSFEHKVASYDFIAKLTLTAIILGSGFKGGEVTPIFFIGATLGNTLSKWIPLPMGLLTGMGFIAVFAACANTPFATILMGIELFGQEGMYYFAISCIIAYLVSGNTGIYSAQNRLGSKFTKSIK
jgi:H+/Cl- antiporter ClcA